MSNCFEIWTWAQHNSGQFQYHPAEKMLYMPKKRVSTRLQYKMEDSYKKNIQRRMTLSPDSPAVGKPAFSSPLVRGWCRVWISDPKAHQPPYWPLSLLHQQCCQDILLSQGKLCPSDSQNAYGTFRRKQGYHSFFKNICSPFSHTYTEAQGAEQAPHTHHRHHHSRVQSALRCGRGFAATEHPGKSQNSARSSSVVVLPHWSCVQAEVRHFCLVWDGSLPVSGMPILNLIVNGRRKG